MQEGQVDMVAYICHLAAYMIPLLLEKSLNKARDIISIDTDHLKSAGFHHIVVFMSILLIHLVAYLYYLSIVVTWHLARATCPIHFSSDSKRMGYNT